MTVGTDVLTLLFTDIEGSTLLWERDPSGMDRAVDLHLALLRRIVAEHDGHVVKSTGDGIFATFERPTSAVAAAARAQRELAAVRWPVGDSVRVRMGLHIGECTTHDGDHYGRAVNKAARLEQAAYGGQVLLSATLADLVRDELGEGLALLFLGDHHFDGITDPEPVFQLSIAGLPRDHPPLRTRDFGIERLPPEMTPIIGRPGVADTVQEALQQHRVVTLVGPPGVGKSRLALRVATESARQRASGVQFVDLTGCRRVDATEATVGTVLGVRPSDDVGFRIGIVRALRATDTLLVLDNCEHVLPAVVPLVEAILASCPDVAILATSRERLDLAAERVWALEPLELPPDGCRTPSEVAVAPAVELLVERARAAVEFEVTADNAGAVAAIVRRCDGLPLALELAAARLTSLSATELLAALSTSIDVLTPAAGRLGRRHPGLREALDTSYAALSATEQALLDELAVFAGFASVAAIADVCQITPSEVRHLVDALVERSLLVARRSGGWTRFRLLESIRQYALEHGRVDDALRARHAAHFVREAEVRADQYRTSEAVDAARALEEEFDDLRLAFQRLIDRGAWSDAARIVLALHPFCLLSMRPELQGWAAAVDGRLPIEDPRHSEICGVRAIGAWFRGDNVMALERGQAALDAAASADGPVSTLWAHTAMLNASGFLGDFEGGLRHLLAVRAESRATSDPWWIVNALAIEAVANASVGMHERALEPAARAVQLAEKLDNPECRYWAAFAQALALRPTDIDAAEAALERALAATRSNGSRFNEGVVLMEQLSVQVERGRLGAGAATALDLLGHLERAGGYGQIWQAVGLAARLLADGGRTAEGALLLAAVAERPRLPAPQSDALIEGLAARLEADPGPVDVAQIRVRAAFLTDAEIIDTCRRELEALLRS